MNAEVNEKLIKKNICSLFSTFIIIIKMSVEAAKYTNSHNIKIKNSLSA